jgi:hypothetical protein
MPTMIVEHVAYRSEAVSALGAPIKTQPKNLGPLRKSRCGPGRRPPTGTYGYDAWACGCESRNTPNVAVLVFWKQCPEHEGMFQPLVRPQAR